jgi:hypothetical protein
MARCDVSEVESIGVRAAQVVALRHGHHLDLPLRHLALGAAMALRTTADRTWPLPDTIDPQEQALGAAALVTRESMDVLAALALDEISTDGSRVRGAPVPVAARPILRAHLWMHRYRGLDISRAFATAKGRTLRGATARKALDGVIPDAVRAAEHGPTRLREVLNELSTITSLLEPPPVTEGLSDEQRILPDAGYSRWLSRAAGFWANTWTGLPDRRGAQPSAIRDAVALAVGLRTPEGQFDDADSPGTIGVWHAHNAPDEPHEEDARVLHGLLLNLSGGASRSTLIRALEWDNTRLQSATDELRNRLANTAEQVAVTLDSRVELRVRTNYHVRNAVTAALAEAGVDRGPSISSMRLLARFLSREIAATPAANQPTAMDEERSRFAELLDRGLVQRNKRGEIELTETAALGCCIAEQIRS